VDIDLGSGPELFFATNGRLVADGKALSQTFDMKGSSSLRPCSVFCANAMKKGITSDPEFTPTDAVVEITCPHLEKFTANTSNGIFASAEELRRTSRRVTAKTVLKGMFTLMEQAVGMTYNPHGLLWDRRLRSICQPVQMYTYDWVHIFLCKGVGGDVLYHLLTRMKSEHIHVNLFESLRNEIKMWKWPMPTGGDPSKIFSDKRVESSMEAGVWKTSAMELHLIAPVVLNFAHTHYRNVLPLEVECFRRFCAIVDHIVALKFGQTAHADTDKLRALIKSHFELARRVYGEEIIIPKWHDGLHIPDQIDRDGGIVLDTLLNERAHQVSKGFANNVSNPEDLEKYCLTRSISHQVTRARHLQIDGHLVGKSIWKEEFGAYVSAKLYCKGLQVGVGNFVTTFANEIVEVKSCGQCDLHLFLLGDACEVLARGASSVRVARRLSLRLIWISDNNDVKMAKCWKPLSSPEQLRIVV
jgi:hypothetical protein